jgi:drug/metabolite transporter (DMT)-like permease
MTNPPSSRSHLARGYSAALLAAVFLSTTAIFIRHLTQSYQMPALLLAFWRDVFVAVTLLPALALIRPSLLSAGKGNLRYLLGYGLVLAVFNAMWTLSVALNGAAVATVMAYSSAAFTALLGWWLLKEKLGWAKILAVTLTLGGCALVSGALDAAAWRANLGGIAAGALSGLCYAAYSLLGRSAAQRGLNPWTTLLYTFGFAAGFLLLPNLVPGGPLPGSAATPADFLWLGGALAGWGELFLLAAGPTVAGFGFYNVALAHLPSSVANLVVTLEPVFTTITAYLLFGERLNAVQVAGSLLILAGVAFMRLYEGWMDRRAQVQPAAGPVTGE